MQVFEPIPIFSYLPDECVILIFSEFGVKDLLTTSLVCKYWLRLCRDDGLWKRVCEKCWEGLEYLNIISIPCSWMEYYQHRKKLEKFDFDFGEMALKEEELEEKKDSYKWKLWRARNRSKYNFLPRNRYLRQRYSWEDIKERCVPSENTNEIILLLESFLQKDPLNASAWTLLGRAHADNDEDSKAIECLVNAISLNPNLADALLLLGISFTNEAELRLAEFFLRRWLSLHPRYGYLVFDLEAKGFCLKRVFSELEQNYPADGDLKLILGVLCCGNSQFDKAVELFRGALFLNPQDYGLWNKLGATLANTGQHKSAEDSYKQALKIKPNFVRGLVNMGTCLTNSRNFEAAFDFYLQALKLNTNASHVWHYMMIGAIQRDDPHLHAKIQAKCLSDFSDYKLKYTIKPEDIPDALTLLSASTRPEAMEIEPAIAPDAALA